MFFWLKSFFYIEEMVEYPDMPESSVRNDQQFKENQLWDARSTHHLFPVFAGAKAFVPTSFESLLVQVKVLFL